MPVLLVLAIIAGIYFCFFNGYVRVVELHVWNLMLYVVFHALLLLLFASYYQVVVVDPGSIPLGFTLTSIKEKVSLLENADVELADKQMA
jgi:hypothetical protein